MAYGLTGEHDTHQSGEISKCGKEYADSIKVWQKRAASVVKKNIGVVDCLAIHHFHGSKQLRGYGERWKILRDQDFNPYTDIFRDYQGIYQLSPEKIKLRDEVRKYFISRCDDNLSLLPGDKHII